MKPRVLLTVLVVVVLTGCWVEEAPVSKTNELSVVSDQLTAGDSLIIKRFAKKHHITVHYEELSPEAILQRIRVQKYNADIDVILTEDEQLRKALVKMKTLRTLKNEDLFGKLNRQFNNRHHYWLPVTHDPLILCRKKDTLHSCQALDFGMWHKKDSAYPTLILPKKKRNEIYTDLLVKSRYKWLSKPPTYARFSNEQVYCLSDYVHRVYFSKDSTLIAKSKACRYYLAHKKRTFSTISTLSIFQYGRNPVAAELFISYCAANAYTFASGRNQLPVNQRIQANWYIRSLFVQ
jgi:spermidine/putrescine-binding protein